MSGILAIVQILIVLLLGQKDAWTAAVLTLAVVMALNGIADAIRERRS